jgi:D-alanyl-D-alanine carboxypeptidase
MISITVMLWSRPLSFIVFLVYPLFAWGGLNIDAELILKKYYSKAQFIGSVRIIRKGQIVFDQSIGLAQQLAGIQNSSSTAYRIQSLTKQFTSLMILQLQEQGLLNVSDSIYKYIPDFPQKSSDINIANLIEHTSGLTDYTGLNGFWDNAYNPITKQDLVARFAQLPLEFTPGSQAKYSNSGFVLLGLIIEAVTQMPFQQAVQKMIFDKIKMKDSGYETEFTPIPFRASGYSSNGSIVSPVQPMDMSNAYAAGALYSSMNDMTSWAFALTRPTLLNQASIQTMLTPVMGVTGLGWAFDKKFGFLEAFHNGGGAKHGFHNRISYFVNQDVIIIILSNLGNAPVESISDELAGLVLTN